MPLFRVESKKVRYEFQGTLQDCVSQLEEDEIPCKLRNLTTNVYMRITPQMYINTKKDGTTTVRVNKESLHIGADY